MMTVQNPKNHRNFFELALLLADEQSRQQGDRWASFIDNLSRICDEFAGPHLSLKRERQDLAHLFTRTTWDENAAEVGTVSDEDALNRA
jgi:hypothetical protein